MGYLVRQISSRKNPRTNRLSADMKNRGPETPQYDTRCYHGNAAHSAPNRRNGGKQAASSENHIRGSRTGYSEAQQCRTGKIEYHTGSSTGNRGNACTDSQRSAVGRPSSTETPVEGGSRRQGGKRSVAPKNKRRCARIGLCPRHAPGPCELVLRTVCIRRRVILSRGSCYNACSDTNWVGR